MLVIKFIFIIAAISSLYAAIDNNQYHKVVLKVEYDKTLKNESYTTFYSYKYKCVVATRYTLRGDLVDKNNISKQIAFREDNRIPEKYRAKNSDYIYGAFQRGHSYSDASADYNLENLKETYLLSNIFPQAPYNNVSTDAWYGFEKRERFLAKRYKQVDVLNIFIFPKRPLYFGKNKIYVPTQLYKIIYAKNHSECYQVANSNQFTKDINSHRIECSNLILQLKKNH